MEFRPLPLDEADGAILAHSVAITERRWPKGRRISSDDLRCMREAGLTSVMAVRMAADDVGEDAAAMRIAARLLGPGLRAARPHTGRVNLFATHDGLFAVDADALHRLNRLHEAIAVACLPAFTPVHAGNMVGTVKIIPFAVPAAMLAKAEALTGSVSPLRLHPWIGAHACLIQTFQEHDGCQNPSPALMEKTVRVMSARLAEMGASLIASRTVRHEAAAVAACLRDSPGDMILLMGASAIADRRDTLPSALEAAGGEIIHFGMPVDPGNLLLLGQQGGRVALGLPGCARSPKLNGVDWVMRRLAAGLTVTSDDIARMGVGGLLAEDAPGRPVPRQEPPRKSVRTAPKPKVTAVILAAGQGQRMGGTQKMLAPLHGKPMLRWTLEGAAAAGLGDILVVVGHEAERLKPLADDVPGIRFIHNPAYREGLSESLKIGALHAFEHADAALVMLGDMPCLDVSLIRRLIDAYDPQQGRMICLPVHAGQRGHPVLWDRCFLPEIMTLHGDCGARALLERHKDLIHEVMAEDDGILLDADTPEALARLAERIANQAESA
jgi:molybdenum cofactor cytidylyltransferase